jgi:hypothetical protein
MHARILPLLIVLMFILAIETTIYILHDGTKIKARQTEEVHLFCSSNSTYANHISVFSTAGDVIGKDDTF